MSEWTARHNAVLAAVERAVDEVTLRQLDLKEGLDRCQVQIHYVFVDRAVNEAPCEARACWWIECNVCGSYRLACDDHASRVAVLSPAFCLICRHEKATAVELFSIAPLPAGV